jgi:hypothetical protein
MVLTASRAEIVGPRAFSLPANREQSVVFRMELSEETPSKQRSSLKISIAGEPGERPVHEYALSIVVLALGIYDEDGAEVSVMTRELTGAALKERRATLTLWIQNLGSVEVALEPFAREAWLRVETLEPITVKPGERLPITLVVGLGGALPADATAAIGLRATPPSNPEVCLEETVRVAFRGVGLISGRFLGRLPFRRAGREP